MRDVARAVFRFAAAVEPEATDASRPRRSPFDPRHLARAGLLTARFGAELFDAIRKGPEVGLAYAELDNKVRAFHLFETVVASLELPEAPLDPAAAIETARRRLGHEQAVWASEGIGYELCERRRRAGRPAQGLLSAPDDGVPSGSWTALHTGMGMALAEAGLPRLVASATPGLLKQALAAHIALCSEAARPGYAPLAFEPLGLVVRLLEPGLVPAAASALAELGEAWRDLFWHGFGRGVYFLPANLPPARSAPWKGLALSREEPTDERGRLNATAGFAWAVTLVNLSRPAVVESFLAHHAQAGEPRDPVGSGVVSALTFWHAATGGGSKDLRRFVGHVAAPERRELWGRSVCAPFETAVLGWSDAAGEGEGRRLAELFRYR
jgi:hypothetical protein